MTDVKEDAAQPLPVAGYTPQSAQNTERVNLNKQHEERILRVFDRMRAYPEIDQAWLAQGRALIEQGFMCVNRAIFKPARVPLPDDEQAA